MKTQRVLNRSSKCANKPGVFILYHQFTKKKSLRNLTRFYGGLFELEILEIFTTVFLLKLLFELEFFFQILKRALLKNKKNLLKNDASHLKLREVPSI